LQEIADDWVVFCQTLCDNLGIALHVHRVNLNAKGIGTEAAARDARYKILFEHARQYNASLAVGHHKNDNEETILYQLLRGTGLAGLVGLRPNRMMGEVNVARPLVEWTRDDITLYCEQHQLPWVEDPTNTDTDAYSRNYIRDLLPQIKARIPTVSSALQRISKVAEDSLELLDDLAILDYKEPFFDSLQTRRITQLSIKRQRNVWRYWLATQHPTLRYDEGQLQEWIRQTHTPQPKTWKNKSHSFTFKKGLVSVQAL
jgi:tRNA(Ile)-lysidine synthase